MGALKDEKRVRRILPAPMRAEVVQLLGRRGGRSDVGVRDIRRVVSGGSAAADPAGSGTDAGRGDRTRGGRRHAVCHGQKLAGYAGTTPRVHASGGKTRFGPSRPDVNRYLKWAFVEAANAVCLTRGRTPRRHVSRLYERVARRKGHAKAIGAVARHLAEATYWMLSKGEAYREPKGSGRLRPRGISAEAP